MLSAVSLTVYSLTHGRLTASVAFTTITVFGSLEMALSFLPYFVTRGLEARISAERIGEYLRASEKSTDLLDGDAITFNHAEVAWPTEDKKKMDCFRLKDLNLQFPSKGLGVIAGRTGSGKSLLLSSILGECDILSGSVQVPSCHQDRDDDRAHPANWIIDSAIAYVAQSPWTENATIKDNILFGLPDDLTRYREVVFASGLEKDLQILPHGDLTDIGANGVNLSGGQRWRVSFARALYSRAGILVMDDIFSALDVDTSRHVFEHGLTGPLSEGRTRILVTHHVGLCLPKINYYVLLDNGAVTAAGRIDELLKTDGVGDILLYQSGSYDGHSSQGEAATKRSSPRPRKVSKAGPVDEAQNKSPSPQKFSPEEKRETGSVSFSVYKTFLASGKKSHLWAVGFLLAILYTIVLFGRVSPPKPPIKV